MKLLQTYQSSNEKEGKKGSKGGENILLKSKKERKKCTYRLTTILEKRKYIKKWKLFNIIVLLWQNDKQNIFSSCSTISECIFKKINIASWRNKLGKPSLFPHKMGADVMVF